MQDIELFLKKYISEIAISIGAVGVVAHIWAYFFPKMHFVGMFKMFHMDDYFINYFLFRDFRRFSFMSVLVLVILIVGGWWYKRSNQRDSSMLKFSFSLIAVLILYKVISFPIYYYFIRKLFRESSNFTGEYPSILQMIFPFILIAPLGYLCYYFVKYLMSQDELDFEVEQIDEYQTSYSFDPVSSRKRFVHMLVDNFFIVFLAFPLALNSMNQLEGKMKAGSYFELPSNSISGILFFISPLFVYYLLFEGIFKATPVKFLTRTRVVNTHNFEKPGNQRIFWRSIARLIPLDQFSFFGEDGWHDSLSKTTVIPIKTDEQANFPNWIWLVVAIGIYVVLYAYSKFL